MVARTLRRHHHFPASVAVDALCTLPPAKLAMAGETWPYYDLFHYGRL